MHDESLGEITPVTDSVICTKNGEAKPGVGK